ncbi:hypothetical protein ABXT70_08485 [Candidatus Njordibacter sp. Uisw_039]|jgi:hypothetical protein|uniref:hypothetical protein n=1 Tax=Candidatus Njordibacter sp. Uisw_039 TaxID=3230972 RepID=UPI003A401613|tara:strand:- start:5101 stop:5673 length:573 start_codon:yes stop_codon:yes gene_type:complete
MTTSNLNKSASLTNFSHIKNTLTMLGITIAQIRTSLSDSNTNVDTLSSTFAQIADNVLTIHDSAVSISCVEPKDQMELELIQAASSAAKAKVGQAVVDFQFFDRLDQRLSHVIKSLDDMSALIQNPDRLQDPMAWMELQSNLHDSYSMESERLMFASIMGGSSIEEAIAIYHAHTPDKAEETEADDVEMF